MVLEVKLKTFCYFGDRVRYISISEETIRFQKIETGIPQVSGLGPLLFILYINDITRCDINCKIAPSADGSVF